MMYRASGSPVPREGRLEHESAHIVHPIERPLAPRAGHGHPLRRRAHPRHLDVR